MARVRRQTAKKKNTKQKTTNSLSKAQPVAEYADQIPLSVIIYGPNRAGKTYLACTFPKPLLLLSFEPAKSGGATSVRDMKGIDVLHVESTEDAIQYAQDLKEDEKYQTVVVDTITSLQDLVLTEILGLEEIPVQLGWGTVTTDQYIRRSETTREILRLFKDTGKNIIFTSKEKDQNPKRGERDTRPKEIRPLELDSYVTVDLGGTTAGWMMDCCDYIFRIYKDEKMKKVTKKVTVRGKKEKQTVVTYQGTGKYVRHLLVDYHPNYAGGCRLGTNREKMPEQGIILEPTYEKIMQLIDGEGS